MKNNMYYTLMVGAIYVAQDERKDMEPWKILSNFYMALSFTCNLFFLYIFINNVLFVDSLSFLELQLIEIHSYNVVFNWMLYALLPFMIMNYFLVYQKKKYIQIMKDNEQYRTKRLFTIYFLISSLLPVVYAFIPKNY